MILPLYYLPNLQYMSKFLIDGNILLEKHEHYNKGSFRNRTQIGTSLGPLALNIPLFKGKHEQMPISEVRIDNSQMWQRTHWRSIKTAYAKAPYWEYYSDSLAPFFQKEYEFLFDWNLALLQWLNQKLQLGANIDFTTAFVDKNHADSIVYKDSLLSAKGYEKAEERDFSFLKKPYMQLFSDRLEFLPNLSCLDLLFCKGPLSKSYLQSCINSAL